MKTFNIEFAISDTKGIRSLNFSGVNEGERELWIKIYVLLYGDENVVYKVEEE